MITKEFFIKTLNNYLIEILELEEKSTDDKIELIFLINKLSYYDSVKYNFKNHLKEISLTEKEISNYIFKFKKYINELIEKYEKMFYQIISPLEDDYEDLSDTLFEIIEEREKIFYLSKFHHKFNTLNKELDSKFSDIPVFEKTVCELNNHINLQPKKFNFYNSFTNHIEPDFPPVNYENLINRNIAVINNCNEYEELIHKDIDNKTNELEQTALNKHLEKCDVCLKYYASALDFYNSDAVDNFYSEVGKLKNKEVDAMTKNIVSLKPHQLPQILFFSDYYNYYAVSASNIKKYDLSKIDAQNIHRDDNIELNIYLKDKMQIVANIFLNDKAKLNDFKFIINGKNILTNNFSKLYYNTYELEICKINKRILNNKETSIKCALMHKDNVVFDKNIKIYFDKRFYNENEKNIVGISNISDQGFYEFANSHNEKNIAGISNIPDQSFYEFANSHNEKNRTDISNIPDENFYEFEDSHNEKNRTDISNISDESFYDTSYNQNYKIIEKIKICYVNNNFFILYKLLNNVLNKSKHYLNSTQKNFLTKIFSDLKIENDKKFSINNFKYKRYLTDNNNYRLPVVCCNSNVSHIVDIKCDSEEHIYIKDRETNENIKYFILKHSGIKDIVDISDKKINFIFLKPYTNEIYLNEIDGKSYSLIATISLYSYLTGSKPQYDNIFATGDIDITTGKIKEVDAKTFNIKLEAMKYEFYKNDIILVPEKNIKDMKDTRVINKYNIKSVKNITEALNYVFDEKKRSNKVKNEFISTITSFYNYVCSHYDQRGMQKIAKNYYELLFDRFNSITDLQNHYFSIYTKINYSLYSSFLHINDIKNAEKIYNEYFKKYKKKLYSDSSDYNDIVNFEIRKSVYLIDNLKSDTAIKNLVKIYESDYYKYLTLTTRLDLLNTLGQSYLYNSSYKNANDILQNSLKISPLDRKSRTLNYIGKNYLYWKKYKQSEKAFNESIKTEQLENSDINNISFSKLGLLKISYYQKKYDDCIETACHFTKDFKGIEWLKYLAYKYLGLSYLHTDKIKATEYLEKSVKYFMRNKIYSPLFYLIASTLKIEVFLIDKNIYSIDSIISELNNNKILMNKYKRKIKEKDLIEIVKTIKY